MKYITALFILIVAAAGGALLLSGSDPEPNQNSASSNSSSNSTAQTQSTDLNQADNALDVSTTDQTTTETTSPPPETTQEQTEEIATAATNPGTYTDYYDGAIQATSGTKLLFFHASWCPQCRTLENDILASEIPEDTHIFKVDYDDRQDLKDKYGVRLQTTVVRVDDSGNLVDTYGAYASPRLDSVITNLL